MEWLYRFLVRRRPLMRKKLGCYRIVKQLSMPAFELAPEIYKSLVEFSYVQCVFYTIGSSISAWCIRAAHCFFFFFLLHIFLTAFKLVVPSIFYFRKVSVASCPLASYFSRAGTSKCQAFSAAIFVLARLHFVHFATPRLFSSSHFFLGLFLYLQRDRVPGNKSSLASWLPILLGLQCVTYCS